MENIIPDACQEGDIDSRNYQYGDIVGAIPKLPEFVYLDYVPTQDQNEDGWRYGCVFFSNSHGCNIMNSIEGSKIETKGSNMCTIAVSNGVLDPNAGAFIISGPKLGTKLGYLDGYAVVNTLEEIKHSIANNRPVQVGSNSINWGSATAENGWTVTSANSYGHSIILDGYDDNTQQLRIKQSYKKWDDGHQYLNYFDVGLLYNSKFSLIDKADPIITTYKQSLMDAITIEDAKKAMEAKIWNGTNPQQPASREEVSAMIYRALNK